jgi:hypothetical protein
MDRVTVVIIVLAVLAVGSTAVYFLWNRRRRAKRLAMELLKGISTATLMLGSSLGACASQAIMASRAARNFMHW